MCLTSSFFSSLAVLGISIFKTPFLIVFNLSFLITIASAYEAQGFLETLNCHYLGFLSFPLPFRLRLSSWVRASYVPVSVCISRVSHFWQDWHQRIINLNFAAKFIHFHPFILCSPIRFLRVIMINRRYVYINITSLEFVLRKYADVKYCFLIIAISVFSI